MRIYLLGMLLLFNSACNNAQNGSDLKKLGLMGNVQSIFEIGFNGEDKFGLIELTKADGGYIWHFNTKGNFKKFEDIGDKSYIQYNYDKNHKLYDELSYSQSGKLTNRVAYKYSIDGDTLNISQFGNDGGLEKSVDFSYSNGKTSSKTEITNSNNFIIGLQKMEKVRDTSVILYKYDKLNRIIETIVNSKRHNQSKETRTYLGDKIFEIKKHSNVAEIKTFKYSNSGNLIECTTFYKPDSNSYKMFGNDIVLDNTKEIYNYDEKNVLENIKFYIGDKILPEKIESYEHDSKGNWIKKVVRGQNYLVVIQRYIRYLDGTESNRQLKTLYGKSIIQ